MITLFQYPPTWGLPCTSPFCTKVEVFLRMAALPYEVKLVRDPRKAPKGKLPFIRDGDKTIADSELILDYLRETHGADLDAGLSPADRAAALALKRLMEEHLYYYGLYVRWGMDENWQTTCQALFGSLKPPFRHIIPRIVRKKLRNQVWAQGLGRHAPAELDRLALADFQALSDWLGHKPFFMGDEPTTIDATGFPFMMASLWQPHKSRIDAQVSAHENLGAYVERMRARYFPELAAP